MNSGDQRTLYIVLIAIISAIMSLVISLPSAGLLYILLLKASLIKIGPCNQLFGCMASDMFWIVVFWFILAPGLFLPIYLSLKRLDRWAKFFTLVFFVCLIYSVAYIFNIGKLFY